MTGQEVFPEPPMVAYKRPRDIKYGIIKAKIPIKFTRHQKSVPGMNKCGKYVVCLFVKEGTQVKSKNNKTKVFCADLLDFDCDYDLDLEHF